MLNPSLIALLPKPISCRLLEPLLTRYVEAAESLTPVERKTVAAHLHSCPTCSEETEAIQAMGDLLRERAPSILPVAVPAADLWDRIEARIIAEESPVQQAQPARAAKRLRPAYIYAPAFAALIVAGVVVPRVLQTNEAPAKPVAIAGTDATALNTSPVPQAMMADNSLAAPKSSRSAPAPSAVAIAPAESTMANQLRSVGTIAPVSRVKTQQQVALRTRTSSAKPGGRGVPAPRRTQESDNYIVFSVVDKPVPKLRKPVMVATGNAHVRFMNQEKPLLDAAPVRSFESEPSIVYNGLTAKAGSMDKAVSGTYYSPVTKSPAPSVAPAAPANTIIVVDANPGDGQPDIPATPVTETLVRARQRRGLFGGYGAGVSTAMIPSGTSVKKSEVPEPW